MASPQSSTIISIKMSAPADLLKSELVVCILFFNKLDQTIESIESFLDAGVEINVLDNGSDRALSDKLKSVFSNNRYVSFLDAGRNRGVAGGRNIQIRNTEKKWLFFVDNDISIRTADWVSKLADDIIKYPDALVHVPRLFNVHENEWAFPSEFVVDESGNCAFIKSPSRFSNAFPGGASIISRKVFDEIGLYDEDLFVGFEDFELAVRAWKIGKTLLVNHVDDIELRHDHRASDHSADRSAAKVRYSVDHITNSHSVIKAKHGVNLDPNFHDWLNNQINYLTGERDQNTSKVDQRDHALSGRLLVPMHLRCSGLTIIVSGDDHGLWLRLRSLAAIHRAFEEHGIRVHRIGLFGFEVERRLITQAKSQGLLDEVIVGDLSHDRPVRIIENIYSDWILWHGHGLITVESAFRILQMATYGEFRHSDRIIFHPERIFHATNGSHPLQWIRPTELNVLEYDQDSRLFPIFMTRPDVWIEFLDSRSGQYRYSWTDAVASYLTELAARGHRQQIVPGTGVLLA